MNEQEAIARAKLFCQAIGEPAGSEVSTAYSTDTSEVNRHTRYYGPVWVVKFSGGDSDEITAAVSAEKGFVCGYSREPFAPWLTEDEPAGAMLTEEDAKEKAEFYRHCAGLTEELVLTDADLHQRNFGGKKGDSRWCIRYDRVAYATPYQYQGSAICLDAETGRLDGFSLNFTSAVATSFNQRLSERQAFALAESYLSVYKNCQIHPGRAELKYVARDASSPMLGWEIHFEQDRCFMVLLVDDRTGRVIRDEESLGTAIALLVRGHHALLKARQSLSKLPRSLKS